MTAHARATSVVLLTKILLDAFLAEFDGSFVKTIDVRKFRCKFMNTNESLGKKSTKYPWTRRFYEVLDTLSNANIIERVNLHSYRLKKPQTTCEIKFELTESAFTSPVLGVDSCCLCLRTNI